MKMCGLLSNVLLSLAPIVLNPAGAHASPKKATLVVGNDKTVCPSAQYSTIQEGVNAAATGETIEVCPGTYAEQVTIEKSLTLAGDNGAIVVPGPMSLAAHWPGTITR